MTESIELHRRLAAIRDFRRARRQAALQQVLARLTGQNSDLLSFDEVMRRLKLENSTSLGLREIPLDAIVGSVGRYTDFTRTFLPKRDNNESRWANVEVAATSMAGLPPIEVYKVGDVYFVSDGNHRVSVARQLGASHIEAYVTEFRTRVPLSPDDDLDDLLLKSEYANFLSRTPLARLRPEADLRVTVPARYRELETHIEAHCFLKNQEQGLPYHEAVVDWYDKVYLPLIELIRDKGLLRDFPNRTETDLYLWIHKHRRRLEQESGWEIDPTTALQDLLSEQSVRPQRVVARLEEKLMDALLPDELEAGPPAGVWRQEWLAVRPDDRLFAHILVPLSDRPGCWVAFDQAVLIAQREQAQLYGLHIVSSEAELAGPAGSALQTEFEQRCQAAGVPGHLSLAAGRVARLICERARWSDLIVLRLDHPPQTRPLARLGSRLRTIIHRSARPILLAPDQASPLSKVLVAYDGSPKAKEGVYVATYLAQTWELPLVVTTVIEKEADHEKLEKVRCYLEERAVQADYVAEKGDVAQAILRTARAHQVDLLVMGGYGFNPLLEVVLGSAVDQVLRESPWPLLVCR